LKKQTFKAGMDMAEAGLQGVFRERFLDFLWNAVKDAPDDAWIECASRVALGDRRPDDLTAGDFLRTLREIRQERAARGAVWALRPPSGAATDWSRLTAAMAADPDAPEASRALARALESRDAAKRGRRARTAAENEGGAHGE
jgi:hypothetical protein